MKERRNSIEIIKQNMIVSAEIENKFKNIETRSMEKT
jgi:hypothetical protein